MKIEQAIPNNQINKSEIVRDILEIFCQEIDECWSILTQGLQNFTFRRFRFTFFEILALSKFLDDLSFRIFIKTIKKELNELMEGSSIERRYIFGLCGLGLGICEINLPSN